MKASYDVNDRKHHRIDNLLFLSLPLAGGLSAVAKGFTPEAVTQFGKHNMRAAKLGHFGLVTASWAAGLTALGLLWGTKDYLAQKIDLVKNNPAISSVLTFVAGFAVLAGVNKAGYKVLPKVVKLTEHKKVLPHLIKMRDALNNSKTINKASEFVAKFPSPIKDMARATATFAPLLVIGTQIGHLFGHQNVKAKVANKNYVELKNAQELIRQDIAKSKVND